MKRCYIYTRITVDWHRPSKMVREREKRRDRVDNLCGRRRWPVDFDMESGVE